MLVDAIEEGKIVRVEEEYAKREGLFVLKKVMTEQQTSAQSNKKDRFRDEKRPVFDDYRKPLAHVKDPLILELKDNFHWDLLRKRKIKNLTRKQVAQSLGVSEVDIKMIENGVLPSKDFVLINKLEKFYGINLRKGQINYQDSFRLKTENKELKVKDYSGMIQKSREQKTNENKDIIAGSDIDLIDL
jgi:ribosome-binding protein aMBF1 (putative translation factor)